MAGSVNRVILIGYLGRDPEVRTFQNGSKVCNLSMATSETWKDRNTGDRHERTEWHSVAIFNEGLAGVAGQYLRKGSKIYIEGKLQTRKWQDQSGQDRYSTQVVLQGFDSTLVMLDARGKGSGERYGADQANGGNRQSDGGSGQSDGGSGQADGGNGQSDGGNGQSDGGSGQSDGGNGRTGGNNSAAGDSATDQSGASVIEKIDDDEIPF